MPEQVTLHRKDGTKATMDTIDARRTLAEHPSEWSASPFPASVVKAEQQGATSAEAEAEAQRKIDAEKARKDAEKSAAEDQAKRDAEAKRIEAEQEEKRKADEKARENGTSDANIEQPITNDGLKVGHIPSEVPALEVSNLEAKHRGRGSYSIMRGDEEVKEGLTKEDADAFNSLSDADKAEYVKG